jgi:hypothetical protein
MDQDEFRAVVRSSALKLLASIIVAGIFFYLSIKDYIKFDALTSACLGFFLMFCAGGKFFPESCKLISRRARNYLRAKKNLEPLDVEDEPAAEIITNFQRRG